MFQFSPGAVPSERHSPISRTRIKTCIVHVFQAFGDTLTNVVRTPYVLVWASKATLFPAYPLVLGHAATPPPSSAS